MLMYIEGDMFESPAQVLVNTVNTEGVMGKGIALTFKKIYPDMFDKYRSFCEHRQFNVGQLYLYKTPGKWILNFPTKTTWRKPSELVFIEQGLDKFVKTYREKGIKSIAFPKLGCGNGNLNFDTQVKPLMDKYLGDLNDIDIYVYLQNFSTDVEHEKISVMKKWLRTNIQNISLNEFIRDIKEYSDSIANVTIKDGYLIFEEQWIDNLYILQFLEYIRKNNIVVKEDVMQKYFKMLTMDNMEKMIMIFDKIEYINVKYKDLKGNELLIYQPFKKMEGLNL